MVKKQTRFALMVAFLILYAIIVCGYGISFGDAYRDPRVFGKPGVRKGYGRNNSNHKRRLGIDLNLFIKGEYIRDTRGHDKLHKFWLMLGGSRMIHRDPNHYSFEHNGMI